MLFFSSSFGQLVKLLCFLRTYFKNFKFQDLDFKLGSKCINILHFTPEKNCYLFTNSMISVTCFGFFCHLLSIFWHFSEDIGKIWPKNSIKNKYQKQKQIVAKKLPADQKNRDLLPKSLRTETYMLDYSEV